MLAKVVGAMLLVFGVMYSFIILFLFMNEPANFNFSTGFYDLMSMGLIWPVIIDSFALILGLILFLGPKDVPER